MCKESELTGTKCTCHNWTRTPNPMMYVYHIPQKSDFSAIKKQALLNYIHGYLNLNYGCQNKNKYVAEKLATELLKLLSSDVKVQGD